ncbi:MAG: PIN domain-containing protein [Anaeromyxobacteraceae bacterium]
MRVILDASVVVAAVATKNPRSAARLVIEAGALGACVLIVTDEIEAEYRDAVEREKVKRATPRGLNRLAFVDAIVGTAERVVPAPGVRVVAKDPKDDKYVAAAIGGRAGYVVSFDRRHLVALEMHEGVRFLTPGDFLVVLRAATS